MDDLALRVQEVESDQHLARDLLHEGCRQPAVLVLCSSNSRERLFFGSLGVLHGF